MAERETEAVALFEIISKSNRFRRLRFGNAVLVISLIMAGVALAFCSIAGALEAAQGFGMLFEKLREVGKDFDGRGAEMVFDAFDVLVLRFGVETEEREKPGERDVPILDFARDFAAFVGHDEAAIFFVLEVARFGQFLNHARDRSLFDLKRGGDIDDTGVAFLLDQFMDALQVIFGALAGRKLRHVASGLNSFFRKSEI